MVIQSSVDARAPHGSFAHRRQCLRRVLRGLELALKFAQHRPIAYMQMNQLCANNPARRRAPYSSLPCPTAASWKVQVRTRCRVSYGPLSGSTNTMRGIGRSSSRKRLRSTAAGRGICLDIHLSQHTALSATASVVATPILILRSLGSNQARANSRRLLFKAFAPIRGSRGSCVPVRRSAFRLSDPPSLGGRTHRKKLPTRPDVLVSTAAFAFRWSGTR